MLTLTASLALLTLLAAMTQLANIASANPTIDPGPDLPRIYIRNNGNVDPATVPIERTGNHYTLTDNIALYTIEIQRDNIVLDGAEHTIQGYPFWIGEETGNNGIIATERKNVNITRLRFEQYFTGIRVSNSSNIAITDNSFANDIHIGVAVGASKFVLVENNTFTSLLTDINVPALRLHGSKNTARNNTLTGSSYGIEVRGSSNTISENKISIALAIELNSADANVIARNSLTGGIWLFANCSNNIIVGNNITDSTYHVAIRITYGSNNTVYGNYMANNQVAVSLDDDGALDNTFYGNTFATNSCKVSVYTADVAESTRWDNGTIGNYWSNYTGTDANGDGVGDTPYTVIGYKWDNNVNGDVGFVSTQDNYPLILPYDFEHDAIVFPSTDPLAIAAVAVAFAAIVAILFYFKKRTR